RKCLAVEAGDANEQAFHQSKLGGEQSRLASHRGLDTCLRPVAPKRKPASKNGVDEIIFQDVRVLLEERLIVKVVSHRVAGGERFQCGAFAVADALREGLNAL